MNDLLVLLLLIAALVVGFVLGTSSAIRGIV